MKNPPDSHHLEDFCGPGWARMRFPDYESDNLFYFQNYIFLYINGIICGLSSRQKWGYFVYSLLQM